MENLTFVSRTERNNLISYPDQNFHNREKALKNVWSYMQEYWTLKDETSEYFLLVKSNETIKGHLLIAILFGWWLLFIPNLMYQQLMKKRMKIFK